MSRLTRLFTALALAAGTLGALPAAPAAAHDERPVAELDGNGVVPTYRSTGPALLVCQTDKSDFDRRTVAFPAELRSINLALWTQCAKSGYHTIQAAVDAVKQAGAIIKILPGLYLEEPSLGEPVGDCAALPARRGELGYQLLTWDQQVACPHNQNLVAVLGKKNLQLEGTGAGPGDVVVDAAYYRLNAVRVDRSPGFYLRNMTVQHTTLGGVYVLETDGFAIDNVVARWGDQYGVLAYDDDHGLITDCETSGNSHSGIDVSSSAETEGDRVAVEVRRCHSHDNLIGFSGTASDGLWAHDNAFTENSTGVALDSAAANHPGVPQNHARFERNVIAANNRDYYGNVTDGRCRPSTGDRDDQPIICPAVGVPPGTGVVSAGGNDDVWTDNFVYGNAYVGFLSSWVPGFVRGDHRVGAQFDTSNRNRYYGNTLGASPDGTAAPNRSDFWSDGQGAGSCWQKPAASSSPHLLPRCTVDGDQAGFGTARYLPEPDRALKLYACSSYDLAAQQVPSDCEWFGAHGFDRIEVRYTAAEAGLLGLVVLLLWARLLRGRGAQVALLGLVLSLGGLGVTVYGALHETTLWPAVGLGLLGPGLFWLAMPMGRRGRPGLGVMTYALALTVTLGALDAGAFTLPWIPVPPSMLRLLLEVVWVPWAIVAITGGRVMAGATAPRRRVDPLVRYAATLRGSLRSVR